MENRYKITMDLKNRTISQAKYKQGDTDSSVIEISLVDGGLPVDITGQSLSFNYLKPDNTIVIQDATNGVSIIDPLNGNFQCLLKNQTLAAPGVVKCEITFKKDAKILSTATFNFIVEQSIGNGDGILSINLIGGVDSVLVIINAAEVLRASAETARVNVEASRVTAESTRLNNETNRVSQESIRVGSEDTRIDNETIRKSNEDIRVPNEATRVANEDARKLSETSKATAESGRVAAETSRVGADSARSTNEVDRVSSEVTRKANEIARLPVETARVNSEATRTTNEVSRVANEVTRSTNETARLSSELDRVSKEGIRVGNETIRLSAESLRAVADTLRATNETDRQNRFNLLTTAQQQASEVINARTSTIKGKTFATLTARIEEMEVDTSSASYSAELTQNAKVFSLGTGKNSVGADIDVSSSVVSGTVAHSIEGNTSDMYSGGIMGADFINKVPGSVVENPNITSSNNGISNTTLLIPSAFGIESSQGVYTAINTLNGTSQAITVASQGAIPQQLFSMNVVAIFEKKFGVIPITITGVPATDLASKIAWLKLNLTNLGVNWTGYGSCPSGNKASFYAWNGNVWIIVGGNTSTGASLVNFNTKSASGWIGNNGGAGLNSDGFIQYLASTDMASGVSPTLLVLTGHGLVANDMIENVTRGLAGIATSVPTVNSAMCESIAGQVSGDVINKYHYQAGTKTALAGTTTTNITITAHGLSTGDFIRNQTRGYGRSKITVVDVDNFTCATTLVGQTSGDIISLYKFIGQQVAEGTCPTTISLTAHGLYNSDLIENVARGAFSTVTFSSVNAIINVPAIIGQVSGDTINKYKANTTTFTAETGTTASTLKITAHGLITGDVVRTSRTGFATSKVTVVDANTLTLTTPITGQVSGDVIRGLKFTGQQIAEIGVIPSTIYTDYISLDMTLKPSYKSVGEDFGGVGVHQIAEKSIGKNLLSLSSNAITSLGVTATMNVDGTITVNGTSTGSGFIKLSDQALKIAPGCCMSKHYLSGIFTGVSGFAWYIVDTKYVGGQGISYEIIETNASSTLDVSKSATHNLNVVNYSDIYNLYLYVNTGTTFTNFSVKLQFENGTVATAIVPYVEDSRSLVLANPLRRVSTTVADKYKDGQVTRNISNWNILDGNYTWGYANARIPTSSKQLYSTINFPLSVFDTRIIKNNGIELDNSTINIVDSGKVSSTDGRLYLNVANTETGFCDSFSPVTADIRAYFYGWKACHSDGVSPYQKNETDYTPSTWAEWQTSTGVTKDSTGLTLTNTGTSLNSSILANIKLSTKYGFLFNLISSNIVVNNIILGGGGAGVGSFNNNTISPVIGNNKFTELSTPLAGVKVYIQNSGTATETFKFKDFRCFELPVGSQIETDFNNLTADQLVAKYLFYGLNPKNWKSVVDGSGQTAVLPTTQAPNYTPYKMLYQLATPTTEIINDVANVDDPTGVLPLTSYVKGSMVIDGGVIVPTTKYIVPINFRATALDNNAAIGALKTYVLKLDSYATNSLLSLADKELRMKAIQLLTTETTTDLKAKINEIITIWRS